MVCKDHLGNEYPSKRVMCEHYGVSYENVFLKRMNKGLSLEDALTIPVRGSGTIVEEYWKLYIGKNGCYVDHLGNYYTSLSVMCDAWGAGESTFTRRVKCGWSVEKALTFGGNTTQPKKDENVIWVFGEPFPDYNTIDRVFGFSVGVAITHKDALEEWIAGNQLFLVDGKVFRSYATLAVAYGLTENTVIARLSRGWSLQKTVHTPVNSYTRAQDVKDHLGNSYPSISAMVRAYGISLSQYRGRMRKGWSLERALTTDGKRYYTHEPKIDMQKIVQC